MVPSPYRPHNPGHDYYGKGTYLITIVVTGRRQLLSSLSLASSVATSGTSASLILSPIGEVLYETWLRIPTMQATHGNSVAVHACVCMPDHFHGVIEVLEPMRDWSLGDIIQAIKATCTRQWHQQQGMPTSTNRPISVDCDSPATPAWLKEKALAHHSEGSLIRSLSKKQRQEYYALVGWQQQPLFDDNYDDTICLDNRHRDAMMAYVNDNPRRAILRQTMPDFMRRCLHVRIGNRSFGAFGNLFLLRWSQKLQVQCHRKHPVTRVPYETTDDYAREREHWIAAILGGQTVIITPGISKGELLMKKECLDKHYPLIHLQKEPIGPYWKPERQRFDACANGNLLILAPWELDKMGSVAGVPSATDYSRFHNLNTIAAELCSFAGSARIIRQ
jgi:REP element-mobilizing transposase RayT